MSQAFQFLVHRRDLDQPRHIAAGPDWNRHMWYSKPEDLVKFPVEPDPIDLLYLVPVFESDNKVEAFFDSNTPDAEKAMEDLEGLINARFNED